ncbi:MAG: BTAD domain-containing putative transcriptional regulator [bacterium]
MRKPVISTAKIARPVQKEIYPRERLFSQLDEGMSRPVTWVTGPGGCGKTTLISSYIESRKLPYLWYQIDQGDEDIATFFYYLGLAAKQAAPRKKKPLPLLTREYLLGITEFTYHFFEELFTRLKTPSLLVFDNYQDVQEGSQLHQVILDGLSRIPEGINIILISRLGPVPAFSRLRANRQLELIGWDELRLSLEEFTSIVRMRGANSYTKKSIRQLYGKLDGWAAGLVLMLEQTKVSGGELAPVGEVTPDEIINYFGEEIIRKIDPEYRDFYFRTSFLPRMTPEMAEKMTGNYRAKQILNYLYSNHLFTEKHNYPQPQYQYHPLFRDFLQMRVSDQFGEDNMRNLRRDAADILVEFNMFEDAAELYTKASDWEGLKKLITITADDMFTQGRHRLLLEWIERLPEATIKKDPWVDYWLGVCRIPFDPAKARNNLARAYEEFFAREEAEGAFFAWSRVVETYTTEWSDFAPLDFWIEELEKLMAHFKDFPSRNAETRVVLSMFSALMYRQPYNPKILEWEERARTLMTTITDRSQQIMLANQLLHYYGWRGSLPKGGIVLKGITQTIRSGDVHITPLARIFVHALDAVYDCFRGSFDESMKAVEKGLKEADSTGIHVWDEMLLSYGIYGSLSTGKFDTGKQLLDRMSSIINFDRLLIGGQYYFLAAWEALCRDDISSAQQYADTGLKLAQEAGHPYAEAILHIGKAQVLIEMEELDSARDHLTNARKIAKPHDVDTGYYPPLIDYMCLINESYLAILSGKKKKIEHLIEKTMALGRKFGFVSVPGGQSSVIARLCARALQLGIETDYVQALIKKRGLTPDDHDDDLEKWPWPLKIYTLGKFELLMDGKLVKSSRKAQMKPLSMLKALISFGGKEVREEQITDALWPDADGDMAHQSFATTLHRLRRIIGADTLILSEGRLSLNPGYCWLDTWAFERAMDEAGATLEKSEPGTHSLELAQNMLKGFEGQFLPEEKGESWAISMQERLHSRYFRKIRKLCTSLEKLENWDSAIEWYNRALEIDELAEDFYRRLMTCYLKLGQKAEGIAVYNRCKKTLSTILGIVPSSKTELVHDELRS